MKHKIILNNFRKKWCKDLNSGFLSPMCHIDDVSEIVLKVARNSRKQERNRIIKILEDNTNFTWIDFEGIELLKEIIIKLKIV
mgnify:CR=1 FL=1